MNKAPSPQSPVEEDRSRERLGALRDALIAGVGFFALSTLLGRTSVVERAVIAVLLTAVAFGSVEWRARRRRRTEAVATAEDGAP